MLIALTMQESYDLMVELMDQGIMRRSALIERGVRPFTILRRYMDEKRKREAVRTNRELKLEHRKHDVFYERKVEIRSFYGFQLLFEEPTQPAPMTQRQQLIADIRSHTIEKVNTAREIAECKESVINYFLNRQH